MNIKYDKILDCLREADTVSVSTGTKYHFLSGESLTISQYFEYFVYRKLTIDSGATITIDSGAELTAHNGILTNFGTITNNGIIEID